MDDSIALTNGRIVRVEAGEYLDSGVTIIVKGGRIDALLHQDGGESRAVHADVTYDLGGRAVLPGLFNTHSHLHLKLPALVLGWRDMKLVKQHGKAQLKKEMSDCLRRGITTIRDCATDDLSDTEELREAIAKGEILGPQVEQAVLVGNLGSTWVPRRGLKAKFQNWAAGLPFVEYDDPASGLLAFDPDASTAAVREAVDQAIDERGADVIKLYEQRAAKVTFEPAPLMTQAQLDAAADQARKRGVPSTVHHVHRESFRRALTAGPTSLAHVPIDELLTEKDLDQLAESGCCMEPTFSGAYGFCWELPGTAEEHLDALARLGELRDRTYKELAEQFWLPELRESVTAGIERARAGKTKFMGVMDLSAALRYHVGYVSVGAENLRRIFDRGVPIGCGNDGGVPPCTVSMVDHELTMLDHALNVESTQRFTAADAIRTATIHSARAMGREDLLGSIEPGKLADLVVIDGDPLEDRSLIGAPADAVFKEGQLVIDEAGLSDRATPI